MKGWCWGKWDKGGCFWGEWAEMRLIVRQTSSRRLILRHKWARRGLILKQASTVSRIRLILRQVSRRRLIMRWASRGRFIQEHVSRRRLILKRVSRNKRFILRRLYRMRLILSKWSEWHKFGEQHTETVRTYLISYINQSTHTWLLHLDVDMNLVTLDYCCLVMAKFLLSNSDMTSKAWHQHSNILKLISQWFITPYWSVFKILEFLELKTWSVIFRAWQFICLCRSDNKIRRAKADQS